VVRFFQWLMPDQIASFCTHYPANILLQKGI
jgi:hypothetical protein